MGGILAFVDLKYSVGRWQGGGGRHQVYTKYKLKLLLLIQGKIYTLDQHPSFVLSPLSLNAKMLGSLYKLSPAEGEVRGCISCAYPKFACFFVLFCFFNLVHGYIQTGHFHPPTVKADCSRTRTFLWNLYQRFHLFISCFVQWRDFLFFLCFIHYFQNFTVASFSTLHSSCAP